MYRQYNWVFWLGLVGNIDLQKHPRNHLEFTKYTYSFQKYINMKEMKNINSTGNVWGTRKHSPLNSVTFRSFCHVAHIFSPIFLSGVCCSAYTRTHTHIHIHNECISMFIVTKLTLQLKQRQTLYDVLWLTAFPKIFYTPAHCQKPQKSFSPWYESISFK